MRNALKGSFRIETRSSLVGSFLYLPSPEVVEIMGIAGLDFVVLDLEHGAYGVSELPNLIRAADSAISPIVRVAENNPAQICKVLDLGPAGVLIPQVENADAAARACSAARYAPRGERGAYPYSRSAAYSAIQPQDHARLANEETWVGLLLEGPGALIDIDSILEQDSDLIFIGPVDLSHALGVPGQIEHPIVIETVTSLVKKSDAAGKATGVYAGNLDQARRWLGLGVHLVAVSVDSAVLLEGYRNLVASLRTAGADEALRIDRGLAPTIRAVGDSGQDPRMKGLIP